MKLLALVALCGLAAVAARPNDDQFDNFDVDELIGNQRLLKAYALCLLDKGNCTPEGKSFKKLVPDGIATSCKDCKHKNRIRKMIKAMQEKLPAEWEELLKIHDPEKKHAEDLAKFLEETD